MMEEADWVAAMTANPNCTVTMSAFADFLQERGDPRWEPLAWLAENGQVGVNDGMGSDGYWPWRSNKKSQANCAINEDWLIVNEAQSFWGTIKERMGLLSRWVAATPEQRDDWLTDPCKLHPEEDDNA
jgi:hypothetical protein